MNSDSSNDAVVIPSPAALRDELQDLVLKDLLGPANGPDEEVAELRMRSRYLAGTLAPRNQIIPAAETDELPLGEDDPGLEDGKAEPGVVPSETLFPSSMGLSFTTIPDAKALQVTARWGWYRRADSETLTNEQGKPERVWKRTPVEGTLDAVPLREGAIPPRRINPEQPDVVVQGQIRRSPQGDWHVSLFLVNNQGTPPASAGQDSAWLFQPELTVEAPDGAPIFHQRRHPPSAAHQDPTRYAEDQAIRMLYREQIEFAVGHGVAVHAEPAPADPVYAVRLSTRVLPIHDVPQQTPPTVADQPDLAGLILDMKALAELPDAGLFATLHRLPRAYRAWIDRQSQRLNDPGTHLHGFTEPAQAALADCERTLARIQAGIDQLAADPAALQAFRFANRAMYLQRLHTLLSEAARAGQPADPALLDVPENHAWRTFQLAFLLLNLPGVTAFDHPERSAAPEAGADLLWFPTGGGKTEAYLGLTAYVLGLRRLQGVIEGRRGDQGVAVLMRYTLRLLTLQQFQRATALLCACEAIRREALDAGDSRWGEEPFRIGLWVGYRTTPNRTDQSADAVQALRGQQRGVLSSPAQLTHCPWCGSALDPGCHILVETYQRGRGRTLLYCGDPLGHCLFSAARSPGEGLPVLVVDEEIYRHPPALLIATVDKFAQLPWKGETQMLFGQVTGYCPRHGFVSPDVEDARSHPARASLPAVKTLPHAPLRPPDLIIQDELHLISGPLGTLVGLYETAIDSLCAWEVAGRRVRPKVIASTATIRQAQEQIQRLFMRRVAVFPPPGMDIRDNFFSRQRPPTAQTPGRRYLGVCVPGDRLKSTLIRVYVAFLAAAQKLYERYGAAVDPWMTLVGYFNSLRELGGMRRLVDDDIRARLANKAIQELRGLGRRPLHAPYVEELTSRKAAGDIPRLLDWLAVGFDPASEPARKAAAREKRKDPHKAPSKPLDVLLATNMISVGVDVRRLGLMIVAGQPKTTAEYIQATSRVGRAFPGLICTVYNWARPRDLSHYESFEHYHATFYQHVEALSVTPFASGALERGLAGILVALIRLLRDTFNANDQARRIDPHHPLVRTALALIAERAAQVDDDPRTAAAVRQALERKLDIWLQRAQAPGRQLGYRSQKDGVTVGLLQMAGAGPRDAFTTLNSMRDVEPGVGLILEV